MTTTPAGAAPVSLDAARTLLDSLSTPDLNALAAALSERTTVLTDEQKTGLAVLRRKFEPHQIAKLPKPNCGACNKSPSRACDKHPKRECSECGAWMSPAHIHLDYVGHAEATDRLLDADPGWNWEPVSWTDHGTPMLDQFGGMWIWLTVCGVRRLGYGDAQGKSGTNAVKEIIGDAIRNASMRFGLALDLWAKTDLPDHTPPHPGEMFYDRLLQARSARDLDAVCDLELEVNDACQAGWMIPGRNDGLTLGQCLSMAKAQLAPAPQAAPPASAPAAELDRREADAMAAADSDKPEVQAQANRELAGIAHEREEAAADVSATEQAVTAAASAEDAFRKAARETWKTNDADALQKVLTHAQTKGLSGIPSDPANPNSPTMGTMLRAQITHLRANQQTGGQRREGAA